MKGRAASAARIELPRAARIGLLRAARIDPLRAAWIGPLPAARSVRLRSRIAAKVRFCVDSGFPCGQILAACGAAIRLCLTPRLRLAPLEIFTKSCRKPFVPRG